MTRRTPRSFLAAFCPNRSRQAENRAARDDLAQRPARQ